MFIYGNICLSMFLNYVLLGCIPLLMSAPGFIANLPLPSNVLNVCEIRGFHSSMS